MLSFDSESEKENKTDKDIKTTFIRFSSGELKLGQKSDMHSKCTNMKLGTQPATFANCQKLINSY